MRKLIYFFVLALFFTGNNSNGIVKANLSGVAIILTAAVLVLIATIGALSVNGVALFEVPFFAVSKNIDIFHPFEKMGAVVISIWILADFACVSFLTNFFVFSAHTAFAHKEEKKRLPLLILACIIVIAATLVLITLKINLNFIYSNIIIYVNFGIVVLFACILLAFLLLSIRDRSKTSKHNQTRDNSV